MPKRHKKGSSYTPKAEDRHWYGNRQTARAAKSAARTGTATAAPPVIGLGAPYFGRSAKSAAEAPEVVAGRNPVVEALRAGCSGHSAVRDVGVRGRTGP